jgi:uncharacterized protein (DUF697 family)
LERISDVDKFLLIEFLVKVFASIGAVVSLTPIPSTDILPLGALISYMIYTIAKLSNHKMTWESSTKFLCVVGVTGVLSLSARVFWSQMIKFVPGKFVLVETVPIHG